MGKNENQQDKQDIFLSSLRKSLFYFCAVSIICIALFLVNVIYFNESVSDWGAYGDYIGGVIGTIFAIAAFISTLTMIHIQRTEFKKTTEEFGIQSKIFNQQQFEQTFFDMLKMIDDKQNMEEYVTQNLPSGVEHQDFFMIHPLIIEIIKNIDNYKKNYETKHKEAFPEDDYKKYVNILKLQLNNSTICDFILQIKSDNNEKLKKYCENYQFFEFTKNICSYIDNENTLLFYDFSAFGDNKIYQRKISNFAQLKEEHFKKLLQYNDREVLLNLAKNSNSLDWILEKLAQNEDINIRLNVAKNQNAPEKALEILSQKDNEENIRKAVAANQNTHKKVLEKLATDKCTSVCETVANNPQTTTDILDKLSQNDNQSVRLAVAQNKNTSFNTLKYLAEKDKYHREICLEIVKHKNTLPETLHNLSQNEDDEVRLEIAKDKRTLPETLTDLSKDKKHKIRLEVAKNNHTPQNTLADLANAENSSENIKIEVAKNTNTSEQTLLELSKMQRRYYYFVIINPVTTSKMLEELYNSILEEEKHIYLLENEKTPLHIMENILKKQWVIYKNNHMDYLINLIKNNKLLINSKNNIVLNIIKEIIKEDDYRNINNIHPIIQQFNQESKEKLITFIKEEIKKDNISVYNALHRLIVDSDNLFSEQDFIDMEKDILRHESEKDYDTKREQLSNMIERKKLQS